MNHASEQGVHFLDCEIRMPLMRLPVRSMVADVAGGRVLLAPGSELGEADFAAVPGVTDIVGTSLFHAAGVPKAAAHFPQAKVWAAPGLRAAKPEMPWTHDLSEASWPYRSELPMVLLRGMPKVNEVVFLHRASGTLFVSDLFFHLLQPRGLGAWIILKMFGTYKRFALSKFFAKHVADREAFESSLREIAAFDFQRIVMCHGENVTGDAKGAFRRAVAERGFRI